MSKETKGEKKLTSQIKNDALDKQFAGCEDKDKCCLFIPIKIGVIIIALFGIFGGLNYMGAFTYSGQFSVW